MKSLFYIFIQLCFISSISSQNHWLVPGAKWTYEFSSWVGYGLTRLEVMQEDTIFGTRHVKKILSTTIRVDESIVGSPLDTFTETSYAFEENQIIYGYEPNWFEYWNVLYDFSKNVGDTLQYMYFGGLSPSPFIVDSTGTIDINGHSFAFQDITYPDLFEPGQWCEMRVIEGLGSINSFFFHSHTILQPFDAPSYSFRCYEDQDIGLINLSLDQVDCDFIEGITSSHNVSNIKTSVVPNPASDFVIVQTENHDIYKIMVVDIVGKIRIMDYSFSHEPIKINISGLENGIFFIIGEDKAGGILFREKISKQED
ncbi:MAG: T9SS type A sorting domain-containing protein [Saprospiraceae bacterium]